MVIELAAIGAVYIVYREYKSGKLDTIVSDLKTKVEGIESSLKAEASNVVKDVKTGVAKVEAVVSKL